MRTNLDRIPDRLSGVHALLRCNYKAEVESLHFLQIPENLVKWSWPKPIGTRGTRQSNAADLLRSVLA